MMASLPLDDEMTQSAGGRKGGATNPQRPPEQGLKCPRCDSPNTKFCYYNNYSLTQPRHFCKTCRRYWTKGGALRNVPVGGGCRKNKKSKSSSSSASSSRMSSEFDSVIPSAQEPAAAIAGLQFFHGLSPPVEFQMAGGLPFSRLNSSSPCGVFSNSNQFFSFGDLSCPTATVASEPGATATSLAGFNYPFPALGIFNEMGGCSGSATSSSAAAPAAANTTPARSSLASSIESLSSINQDLHWKLQQQRLALIFGGENHGENTVLSALPTAHDLPENQHQPVSYQIPESSKPEVCVNNSYRNDCAGDSNATTGWFLENSYATANTNNGTNSNTANNNTNTGNWNTWNDMHQFGTLP